MYKSKFTGPEVDDAIERVLNEETFNTSGRYPEMSVGFSDELVGRGESVPAEFSFRASGGKSIKDGTARIKRLKGNSVVWNNMIDTREYEGEFFADLPLDIIQGHKYLLQRTHANNGLYLIPVINGEEKYEMSFQNGVYAAIFESKYTGDSTRIFAEAYCGACVVSDLTKMFGAGNEPTTIEEYEARKPIVADEYAYNEGEVIHMTAEGVKSIGDNAWDEEWEKGFIDTSTGEERDFENFIRGKNFNRIIGGQDYYLVGNNFNIVLYDENYQWIDFWGALGEPRMVHIDDRARYFKISFKIDYGTTYKNDAFVSLYHSGWKAEDAKYQPYWEDRLMFDKRIKDAFPNGMQRWDMVYNKNGKGYIVMGTGVVDLGSLSWYDDTFNGVPAFATQDVTNGVRHHYDVMSGALNALYSEKSQFGYLANSDDKVFVFNSEEHAPNTLAVRDTAYTNASEFKAAMNGVMFYYQLAEPTIIEYDEPFNLDYKVADFGTEEIIAEQPSAPISADIIYQFNAVDMIRENYNEIQQLKTMIATMQAQLTSLTSNNGGQ